MNSSQMNQLLYEVLEPQGHAVDFARTAFVTGAVIARGTAVQRFVRWTGAYIDSIYFAGALLTATAERSR